MIIYHAEHGLIPSLEDARPLDGSPFSDRCNLIGLCRTVYAEGMRFSARLRPSNERPFRFSETCKFALRFGVLIFMIKRKVLIKLQTNVQSAFGRLGRFALRFFCFYLVFILRLSKFFYHFSNKSQLSLLLPRRLCVWKELTRIFITV